MGVASEVQTKILTRGSSTDGYRIYRAALEWDLTEPIVIQSAADFKSEHQWKDRLTPFHHQVTNLITFCRRLPVTLLADDVGLGKTISAGLVISELISRSRLAKILIVCPKVLGPQWKEELESKFGISAEIAIGRSLLTADPSGVGAVITTYNSARLYLADVPEDRFQMLVLDEAHKLRNLYGSEKPPKVAQLFKKCLEERRFRFVLMLTATPIQNRLWDLYSLVDLLTVARGHENPFGSEGMFVRKFIADGRVHARQLRPEAKDEFRSIVYGYMSRVRRGDAKLHFPDRVVQMHKVVPTAAELELIGVIAAPIQKLNRLVQISILQALTSSPHALSAQLANMARNGSVPVELAEAVSEIVERMPPSAKLHGLGVLIEKLKAENPERWRLVVFTGRLETQTTIQAFLENNGLKVGIINGQSGQRNQDTIASFRQNPPGFRVIVSTEAGSEGVNLQVANVLVNYDLPWNPMIVEQRIGRIQRLASPHEHVSIFNVTLKGTFEEYIVGRLMEKLQMAAHAIGDIESLLHGSDIGDGDDDSAQTFEDQIRELVVSALAGKDVERETKLKEKSIEDAKLELARGEEQINALLGSMDGSGYVGPRSPNLPPANRSMAPKEFTLAALRNLGVKVSEHGTHHYLAEENGGKEYIRFDESVPVVDRSALYIPGSAGFQRLVSRMTASGVHNVEDSDSNPVQVSDTVARDWIRNIGADPVEVVVQDASRLFDGNALLRIRATVAHDSYEHLLDVRCSSSQHRTAATKAAISPVSLAIEDPRSLGLNLEVLSEAAFLDAAIAEFSRFYLERREQEMSSAGGDERKRKKLEDDFTPRLDIRLVGLEGAFHREVNVQAKYRFGAEKVHQSILTVTPYEGVLTGQPAMRLCSKTAKMVPVACLGICSVTGAEALIEFLAISEVSGRAALPEFMVVCELSKKRVIRDEARVSSVTGQLVANIYLRSSSLSGLFAEVEYFGKCEFTDSELLKTELVLSEISSKNYRIDQQNQSAITGKTGHKHEFISCEETGRTISVREAEKCEVTGKRVMPGLLQTCEVTGKRVIPSELEQCAITNKRALRSLLVSSSLSKTRMLEDAAIRSSAGAFCSPLEVRSCSWSASNFHPDDLRECGLTGLPIHFEFSLGEVNPKLKPLVEMLNGIRRTSDEGEVWETAASRISSELNGGKCSVKAAVLSPSKKHVAICSEVRTFLGLKVIHVGGIFDLNERAFVGRIASGKRESSGWVERRN